MRKSICLGVTAVATLVAAPAVAQNQQPAIPDRYVPGGLPPRVQRTVPPDSWTDARRVWTDCVLSRHGSEAAGGPFGAAEVEQRLARMFAACAAQEERLEYLLSFQFGAIRAREAVREFREITARELRKIMTRH